MIIDSIMTGGWCYEENNGNAKFWWVESSFFFVGMVFAILSWLWGNVALNDPAHLSRGGLKDTWSLLSAMARYPLEAYDGLHVTCSRNSYNRAT